MLPFSPSQQHYRLVWMVAWPSPWAWPVRVAQWRVSTGCRVLAAWAPVSRHRWMAQSTSQACSRAWIQRSVHVTQSKLSVCDIVSVHVIVCCLLTCCMWVILCSSSEHTFLPIDLKQVQFIILIVFPTGVCSCSHYYCVYSLEKKIEFCHEVLTKHWVYSSIILLVTLKFKIVFRRAWERSRPTLPDRNSQQLDHQGCTL